jgi:hypothetical protein
MAQRLLISYHILKEGQMEDRISNLLLSYSVAAMSVSTGSFALAQAPTPQPAPIAPIRPPAGTYYANQLPETRGTVQRFTLTPIGELDGFILADGTEVHLPPHLTTQLASAVRVGDTVAVQGYRSPSASLVVAASVTDTNTGESVVDNGPPPLGSRPPPLPPGMPAPGAQQVALQGKVQRQLYGPAGDVNGALLDDGTIVRMPPPFAYQLAALLDPGQTLTVQGWSLTTAYGRVVDAQAVGPSSGQMTQVAPPTLPGYAPVVPPPGPPPR